MAVALKKTTGARLFTCWDEIAEQTADAFAMTESQRERFARNRIAKLIASIPFLAECEQPHRTALSHLATYIVSCRVKGIANPTPADDHDIMARLALIANFIGGDRRVIDRGMALLALNMVADYQRDIAEDLAAGKHNPVASGAFDFETESARLHKTIVATECPEMDDILDADGSTEQFWSYE